MRTKIRAIVLVSFFTAFIGSLYNAHAGTDFPDDIKKVAISLNSNNLSYLFTLCEDGNVYLKKQNYVSEDYKSWPGGNDSLGSPDGVNITDWIAAGKNKDGRVWLFTAVDKGYYRIYYRRETAPGSGEFDAWSMLSIPEGGYGKLTVANQYSGELVLFYRNLTGGLGSAFFDDSSVREYDDVGTGPIADNYTVGINPDGRLEVFTPRDDHVRHIYQTTPGDGNWASNWSQLGPKAPAPVDLTADIGWVVNQLGSLEVFIVTTDNELFNCWQDGEGPGGWANRWNAIGNAAGENGIKVFKKMVVVKRHDGGLDLIYTSVPSSGFAMVRHLYQLPRSNEPGWEVWKDGENIGGYSSIWVKEGFVDTFNMVTLANPDEPNVQRLFVPWNYNPNDVWVAYARESGDNPPGWAKPNIIGM